MASDLVKKAALALPLLLASLVPLPSTCQDYGDDNSTEPSLDTSSPMMSSVSPDVRASSEQPVTEAPPATEFSPGGDDKIVSEKTESLRRVTTALPPYKPATLGSRGPVYQGTFRECSSHKDCLPDECCIYGLSRGDSCVKHFKPCPVVEVPTRRQPLFCPPYNSGGYFYNVCTEPEDCPYPYLCCRIRGSYLCVPSFYDRRRRRRRRRRRQAAVSDDGDLYATKKWLGLG